MDMKLRLSQLIGIILAFKNDCLRTTAASIVVNLFILWKFLYHRTTRFQVQDKIRNNVLNYLFKGSAGISRPKAGELACK